MKNYMISYRQRVQGQNEDMISFAVARTGTKYAQVDNNLWYVRTWLNAGQIKDRLAFWFEDSDELRVYELGEDEASLNSTTFWNNGSLKPPVAAFAKKRVQTHLGYNSFLPVMEPSLTEPSVENWQEA